MRPFTFKLESVRALREQVESEAKERLARELAAVAGRRTELQEAADRASAARDGVAAHAASGADLVARQRFLERREREVLRARAELAEQERQVAEERESLARAAREREVLERLKERHRARHDRAAARAEDAALGEIALAAHRRQAHTFGDAA